MLTDSWSALVPTRRWRRSFISLAALLVKVTDEDSVGADAAHAHQVGHPVGDDAGLAAPRPRHYQHGAFYGLHRLPLGGVKPFEDVVCCRHAA